MTKLQNHYIYLIQNLENLKIYVGQTINYNRRWNSHKSHARQNKNSPLYNAIRKYGKSKFKFQVIETHNSVNDVNEAEKFWISYFNTTSRLFGYNIAEGGNSNFGFHHSLKTKKHNF